MSKGPLVSAWSGQWLGGELGLTPRNPAAAPGPRGGGFLAGAGERAASWAEGCSCGCWAPKKWPPGVRWVTEQPDPKSLRWAQAEASAQVVTGALAITSVCSSSLPRGLGSLLSWGEPPGLLWEPQSAFERRLGVGGSGRRAAGPAEKPGCLHLGWKRVSVAKGARAPAPQFPPPQPQELALGVVSTEGPCPQEQGEGRVLCLFTLNPRGETPPWLCSPPPSCSLGSQPPRWGLFN